MAGGEPESDDLWTHYRSTWPTMFAIQAMALVIGLSVAVPALSIAINRALAASGSARLSDVNLQDFLLGPSFPLLVATVAFVWVVIHVFGYAAQLVAAHASFHGAPVSVFSAIGRIGRSIVPLSGLAFRFLLKIILIALPFLLVVAGVLFIQFRTHDLSHFLENRPPDFLFSVAFILVVLAAMTVVLSMTAARWVHVLPLVLFQGKARNQARRISRKMSRPDRYRICLTFALWALGTPLLALAPGLVLLPAAILASRHFGSHLGILALFLSVLVLLGFLIAILVGFVSLTFLVLRHVRYYRHADLDAEDSPPDPELAGPIRRVLVGVTVVAGLTTIGLSYRWLDGLRIRDQALVIGYRGASTDTPENTLIAFERAFDRGADGIAADLRLRADGEPVAFADPDFTRVAGMALRIDRASEAELADIDVGTWRHRRFADERVPTIDRVARLCPETAHLFLHIPADIPPDGLAERIAALASEHGLTARTRVVCPTPELFELFRNSAPDLKLGISSSDAIDKPIGLDVDFIIVPADTLRAELADKLHRSNIGVFAAETTDPVLMSAVLSRGADGIITTAPGLGFRVIQERAVLNPGERLLIEIVTRLRDSL